MGHRDGCAVRAPPHSPGALFAGAPMNGAACRHGECCRDRGLGKAAECAIEGLRSVRERCALCGMFGDGPAGVRGGVNGGQTARCRILRICVRVARWRSAGDRVDLKGLAVSSGAACSSGRASRLMCWRLWVSRSSGCAPACASAAPADECREIDRRLSWFHASGEVAGAFGVTT